jgi:shikimate kinase
MNRRVYLVGMPGSGKSSVGQELAVILGLPFGDLDAEIEAAEGRSIEQMFAGGGERAFRRVEAAALRSTARGAPAVVACGGGIVMDRRNRELMRSTGTVVFLDLGVDALRERLRPFAGRPLLRSDADLKRLFSAREGLYREAAHIAVDASGSPADVARAVAEALA